MKIGRNDKCPCGSGKKFKRCCLEKPSPGELNEMRRSIENDSVADLEVLKSKGIFINLIRPVTFQGRKIWALGNRVYPDEPPSITFGEFILKVLKNELGRDWWEENSKKPVTDQHYIFRAFDQFEHWKKRVDRDARIGPDGSKGALPDGWTYNLLSFAFDVAVLIHGADGITDDLLDRLRNRAEYQGARYEVAVASIFARMGCKITFIENHLNTERHPEFYAEIPDNGLKVAVEAKSKHRPGVIHETGQSDVSYLRRTRVVPLINAALKQNPGDIPFIIFVDINQPFEFSTTKEEHLKRLMFSTANMKKASQENPDEFALLYLTNYSGQFLKEQKMTKTFPTFVIPQFTTIPLKNDDFLNRLHSAVNGYGYIPHLTPEGIYLD